MKKIIAILMAFAMVLLLCGCSAAAEQAGNQIVGAAIEQLVLICTRILEGALAVAFTWLITKAGENVKLKNTTQALSVLKEVTLQTVGELQQLYVNEWKEASGGKLSKEQIKFLRGQLFEKVYGKLTEASVRLITASGADLDALIAGYAENCLNEMKELHKVCDLTSDFPPDEDEEDDTEEDEGFGDPEPEPTE